MAAGVAALPDFTVMALQDPVSVGGTWTNNTQATGSNTAYNEQSSMRVIAAASGGINIATGDATGQTAPPAAVDYMDSFAFMPGYSGNQRITATLYVDSGYAPTVDTHEIELILGCATTTGGGNGTHKWIEFGWSHSASNHFLAVFGRGAVGSDYAGSPNDFTILSPTDTGSANRRCADGDVWIAEFNRSTSSIISKVNGTQILSLTDSTNFASLGDGIGIAMFRRTANGDAVANKLGFRNVTIESF